MRSQARGHCCPERLGVPGGNNVVVSLGCCEVGGYSEKSLRGMRGANVLAWRQSFRGHIDEEKWPHLEEVTLGHPWVA